MSKVFLKEYLEDVGVGAFRVSVAVGGLLPKVHAFVEPKYCFAFLYYDEDVRRVRVEFRTDWR